MNVFEHGGDGMRGANVCGAGSHVVVACGDGSLRIRIRIGGDGAVIQKAIDMVPLIRDVPAGRPC
jgi:hypothetical protein